MAPEFIIACNKYDPVLVIGQNRKIDRHVAVVDFHRNNYCNATHSPTINVLVLLILVSEC